MPKILKKRGGGEKLSGAIEFLRTGLADGWRLASELLDEAHKLGISDGTLRRAIDEVEVRKRKASKFGGGWEWSLPKSAAAGKPSAAPPPLELRRPDPELVAEVQPPEPWPFDIVPPGPLSPLGRAKWCHLIRDLKARKSWSDKDSHALYILASSLAIYELAEASIIQHGVMIEDGEGGLSKNPAITIQNQAWDRACKLFGAFGLHPAGRLAIRESDQRKNTPADLIRRRP